LGGWRLSESTQRKAQIIFDLRLMEFENYDSQDFPSSNMAVDGEISKIFCPFS
jgi:hypothetical protein